MRRWKLLAFLQKHMDDILAIIGIGLVIGATWMLSVVAALYVAGGFCLVGAVLIGLSRSKNDSH